MHTLSVKISFMVAIFASAVVVSFLLLSPAAFAQKSFIFTANANDDVGLSKIEIFVDGKSIGSCSVSGKSASCTKVAGPFSVGTHNYFARATDSSGQTSTSPTRYFQVEETFDFGISVSPTFGEIVIGDSEQTTVSVSLAQGTGKTVSLSCATPPTGISCSFSPTSCTPPCSSQLTVSTSSSAAAANHSITVSGTGGGKTRSATYTLHTVPPGDFDFSIDVRPDSVSVPQGSSNSVSAFTTLTRGNTQAVTFSASGMPSGMKIAFSPTECSPSCSSKVTITSGLTTPLGTYPITISATDGMITRSDDINVFVGTAGAPFCGNNVCDADETQNNCPTDCKTTVSLVPSSLSAGDSVMITIDFTDSRYIAGHNAKFDLTILPDRIVWTQPNGCELGGKRLSSDGKSGTTKWPVGTISEDGHFRTSFTCTVPDTVTPGAKTLVAVPTIY